MERKLLGPQLFYLMVILATGTVMLAVAWVGYVGSDDHSYARGALGWLHQFPFVGDDHWTLRHTVVIPIAASLAVFGFREISLGLPSALFFLIFLVMNYYYLHRFFGNPFALLTSVFMATVPLFAVQATFPQTTIIETLAVSFSFWLFYTACRINNRSILAFLAGLTAGIAFMTKETTAGLPIFYGVLFLVGFGMARRHYWVMALGFVLIIAAEVTYFTALTGDPWYRYRIDLFHDAVDRVGEVNATANAGASLNTEGNLSLGVFLDPFVALLLNQEFGLLFWAFPFAAIWACRSNRIPVGDRQLLRLLAGLAVVWITFISVNASALYVVPRYYAVATWAAVIIVAYCLHHIYRVWHPRVTALIGITLVATNLICVYLENKNPLFAERKLVDYVRLHRDIVYTDPMTMTRAKLLLEFAGVNGLVSAGPVPPNSLFYSNLANLERCKRYYACKWPVEQYLPQEGWKELARIDAGQKLSGILLTAIGLDKVLPEDVFERFNTSHKAAVLYLTRNGSR